LNNMMYLPRRLSSFQFTDEIVSRLSDPADVQFMYSTYQYNDTIDKFEVVGNSLNEQKEFRLIQILNKAGYPYEYDLSPITDDKPFPYNVYARKTEVYHIFRIILILSLLLIIPCILIILNKAGQNRVWLIVPNLFAAALGFAYILTEIVLMQVFQKFLGVPTVSFIVVLGALLLFGGIGSFISRYLKKRIVILLVALIPICLLFISAYLDNIFLYFADKDYSQKIIVSLILLFPITFLMGVPFPNAVEKVKKRTSKEYAALMMAISGGFSTVGTVTGILLNVTFGYTSSYVIAIICYLLALYLFTRILKSKPA
jgi:MFS family permease